MSMPPSGTFDYVLTVPERIGDNGFECRAAVRKAIVRTGDRLFDSRLVGTAPLVRVIDAGVTPDASPQRPAVMRSRITLAAANRQQATLSEASFHVDKALTSSMIPGDEVHLARTSCGGLGLSVLRGGELVVAVGAVTAVPLGPKVRATIPGDLIADATAVFQHRDPGFRFREWPVEVRVSSSRAIAYGGLRRIEDHSVSLVHGFLTGVPGTNECGAIYHTGACPDAAAAASAMLMDGEHALSMSALEQ